MRTSIARLSVCAALGLSAWLLLCSAAGRRSAAGARRASRSGVRKKPVEELREEGVPIKFKKDLALWSAVTFLIFLFLLGRYAWKPLIAALDDARGEDSRRYLGCGVGPAEGRANARRALQADGPGAG